MSYLQARSAECRCRVLRAAGLSLSLSCACGECGLRRVRAAAEEGAVAARVARLVAGPLQDLFRRLVALAEGFEAVEDFKQARGELAAEAGKLVEAFLAPEAAVVEARAKEKQREDYRKAVVDELAQTEVEYLEALNVMATVWQADIQKSKLLTPAELNTVFGNVEQLTQLSTELVHEFKIAKEQPVLDQRIGESFKKRIPFIRLYTEYTTSRNKANEVLTNAKKNHRFVQLLEKLRRVPEVKNLDLPDYLIQPTQRIVKYPLLLKDIIKHTEMSHPDYKALVEADIELRQVLQEINENNRMTLTMAFLTKFQPNIVWKGQAYDLVASKTMLVLVDTIKTKFVSGSSQDGVATGEKHPQATTLICFDTFIIAANIKPPKYYQVGQMLLLNDVTLQKSGSTELSFTVAHKTNNDAFVCEPRDVHQRQHWITTLSDAIRMAPIVSKKLVPIEADIRALPVPPMAKQPPPSSSDLTPSPILTIHSPANTETSTD
eukprot:TRINITY_DN3462_c0_g1_i3.p1 TRINITY_DN3462_c0_g1~~TRINITY_DN3462_c0_g1_i3.p1  ORF type:complete len:491 (-),score=113.30 TRINITY_DN3462_c0_g1_i3:743-2215(-)